MHTDYTTQATQVMRFHMKHIKFYWIEIIIRNFRSSYYILLYWSHIMNALVSESL